jgi:2-polyprenyl-6-methoxyphenol hydroxylase-like FAD-dependent oxidoreductase
VDADVDVIVVGAGPVGMTTALLIAGRGYDVAIFEKWRDPYGLPRAVGMAGETMRVLQQAGLSDAIGQVTEGPLAGETLKGEFLDREGEVLLTAPFVGSACGWPSMAGFNQPDLERYMDEMMMAHSRITVRRGVAVTRVTQDDDMARVAFGPYRDDSEADDGGDEKVFSCRLVIGCDGANTTVRQFMDTEVFDLGFEYDWLVVDVLPHERRTWKPNLGMIIDSERPVTIVPSGPPGRRRFEFMCKEGETPEEMNQAEVAWRLMAQWDLTPSNTDLVRHAVYTFRGLWAERWRDGRIVLAGDAAHLMPPFLAQGMNSGMRDAVALAWRADLVLSGRAPWAILDDYGVERREHVRQIVEQAVESGRMICITDPVIAAERDAFLKMARDDPAMVPPAPPEWLLGPGASLDNDPVSRRLGVQGRVQLDGKTGLLDDLIGGGRFQLLSRSGDPLEALGTEARLAWESLDGFAAQIGGNRLLDTEGIYTAWLQENEIDTVLFRPDFYVYGSGTSVADVDRLVLALAAQLRLIGSGANITSPS